MERIEFDVNLTKEELRQLVNVKDNIESIINDIQRLYNSIDDKVWLSTEKKKLDEYIIPYMEEKKREYISHLTNYNESLRIYADGYGNLINKISGSVENGY